MSLPSNSSNRLPSEVEAIVLQATESDAIAAVTQIQSLWSGYGSILRVELKSGKEPSGKEPSGKEPSGKGPSGKGPSGKGPSGKKPRPIKERIPRSVIVKWVASPQSEFGDHPRGWNTDRSHQRKLRSYQVESNWYRDWSGRCDEAIRVPKVFTVNAIGGQHVFVLEDLDASGFDQRRNRLDPAGVTQGLRWLARFHANFLGETPTGLWPQGTYWHLETRTDELAAMAAGPLRDAAEAIDRKLNECRYQTLVHGDAKVANFCFRADGGSLAAVDFQYVGGGCGMKDVAYFLSSCVSEAQCERDAASYLDTYFETLRAALKTSDVATGIDADALEYEWRSLYGYAWADFTRFLLGWCPGHPKLNPYSQRITDDVLRLLDSM